MADKVRHPLIMKQLGEILPPGPRKPETLLGQDLGLGPTGKQNLATEVERAWSITVPDSAIATWRTIADVADTIANAVEMATA